MSYIGNQPFNASFLTDTFSGNGSTTSFTMQIAPAGSNSMFVIISGVVQAPSTYGVVGNQLNFTQAPPAGTGNIVCRYLGLPASNVTTSAYRSYTELTASAGQTTFTSSAYTPGFIDVYRNGVKLNNSSFTATNGSTVVLGTPTNAGDSVVVIGFFVSSVLNAIPNTAGSVGTSNYDISGQGGSGAIQLPTGTTGQRPASPQNGMLRKNTTTGLVEHWDPTTSAWISLTSVIQYDVLVVAGGGGTGYSLYHNGGGGGGGLIYSSGIVSIGQSYAITVGAGGTGGTSNSSNNNTAGNNSIFGLFTAVGGGKGGTWPDYPGGNGGSGGGGAENGNAPSQVPGTGTTGQGYAGGQGNVSGTGYGGGGGGGAGAVGGTGILNTRGGNGGTGLAYTISGASQYYGGGGGGANYYGNSNSSGGSGGGAPGWWSSGSGAAGSNGAAGSANATANTGGGAGGYERFDSRAGAVGGSGVVILRIPSAYTATFTGGLTTSLSNAVTGYKIYTVTNGTGSVTIS